MKPQFSDVLGHIIRARLRSHARALNWCAPEEEEERNHNDHNHAREILIIHVVAR